MPDQSRWEEAKRLFHAALAIDETHRERYLRDACADTPDLLAEVQSLLAWHRDSTEFLETPVARVGALPFAPIEDVGLAGQSIGPWRIVDVIGRGGMGVVYRAERADAAFRRTAAIKVVRLGPHAAGIVERFHQERETLAALDHPNIARLLDGGTTADGQPYFVMELVDGVPVDRYCDERRLTVDRRLDLFQAICAGVQYAHENLVVHRDIKPDNILVSHEGTPKLLDFGVAKIISREVADPEEQELLAATWLMTPDYASPEQVSGRALVTTASDVYSLGVLLHVLLTGTRPYHLTGTTPSAIQTQFDTTTLRRPSERVRGSGGGDEGEAEARASRRGMTPRQLSKRLAGDLDAIVMRALARDPSRRYSTVRQLADDVQSHRTAHPVAARGRDVADLTRKFVRRHAVALAVTAGVALLAAAGVAAVLWQAAIAAEARVRAERRFDDVRKLAHAFMFDVHDAIVNVPGTTAARAQMVRTAVQYLDSLSREAADDRGLQRELAGAFVKVGDAQGHPTSPNVGDTAGALASYRRAIDIAESVRRALPDDLEATRTLAMAHRRLADVLAWAGDTTAALADCERSQRLFAEAAGRPSPTLEDRVQAGIAQIKLGDVLGNPNFPNLGRQEAASARYDVALAAFRRLDAEAPADQRVRRYLGLTLERIGTLHEAARQWPQAMAVYTESFEIRQALAATAPLHTDIQRDLAIAYEKLGNVARFTSNVTEAAVKYRGALAQFERLARLDPSNAAAARTVAISKEKLGQMLAEEGAASDAAEATALLRGALDLHRSLAAGDPNNAQARCDLARVAEELGDVAHARRGPASRAPDAGTCATWRESARTREALHAAGRTACATSQDLERVTTKLRACR